jgi:hypothetical protein
LDLAGHRARGTVVGVAGVVLSAEVKQCAAVPQFSRVALVCPSELHRVKFAPLQA